MNNEEKKQFIIDAHKYYMECRPYDGCKTLDQLKRNDDLFWEMYSASFCHLLPKSLFKYRKPTENAIKNFANDVAWFSHPKDFDDSIDSVLNNDIENELKEYEKNPQLVTVKLAKAFICAFASSKGISIDEKQVEEALPLFKLDGSFDEENTKQFLYSKMSKREADECLSKINENTSHLLNDSIISSVKEFLLYYFNINQRITNEALVLSLAEEGNNQAMWGLYADESKGFCIEYAFPDDTITGQRMLSNLFPIYYGEKPVINFFDVLIRGLYAQKKIDGIAYEDYQDWFLSAYTKDETYEFQKEWRVSVDKIFGGNLQHFPFAKSIILGERMSDINKTRLIEIAKGKHIDIYIRRINKTGSRIVVEKYEY